MLHQFLLKLSLFVDFCCAKKIKQVGIFKDLLGHIRIIGRQCQGKIIGTLTDTLVQTRGYHGSSHFPASFVQRSVAQSHVLAKLQQIYAYT